MLNIKSIFLTLIYRLLGRYHVLGLHVQLDTREKTRFCKYRDGRALYDISAESPINQRELRF